MTNNLGAEFTPEEVSAAIENLVHLGVLGRWWCETCQDWVPYKKLALDPGRDKVMTERQSRRHHNEQQHEVYST